MADLRNVGRCDIVGFEDPGVYISLNNDNEIFGPPILGVSNFGYECGGWRLGRRVRFLVDVTGDGRTDIVGFGENNVVIGRNNSDGTFSPGKPAINNFCYSAGGWRIETNPRFVADLTGDGRLLTALVGRTVGWSRNTLDSSPISRVISAATLLDSERQEPVLPSTTPWASQVGGK